MISLKRASREDLPALERLEEESFSASDYPLSRANFLYHIKRENPLFLAYEEGWVLGYALGLLRPKSLRLYSLAVGIEYRHQGVGKRLLEGVMEEAMRLGKKEVTLEVRESNQRARILYEKAGFELWKRLEGYYPDGEAGVRLRKALS